MKKGLLAILLLIITALPALAAPGNTSGPWGIAIATFSSLSSAKQSPVTANKTMVITTVMDCGDLTIPADRPIDVKPGGRIRYSGHLTINGPFNAGLYQALEPIGAGYITLSRGSVSEVYPQWWGGFPNGVSTPDELGVACLAAWECAYPVGLNIKHTSGVWNLGHSFPYRAPLGTTELLDAHNTTVTGTGWNTVLMTTTPGGGDVLQLNMLKNFTVRDLAITSVLTGFAGAGSNAISITGGFDNLNILDIYTYNLAYVDNGFLDGGKGVTFQVPSTKLKGSAVVRFVAKGCTYAFDYTNDLDDQIIQPTSVRVDVTAIDCYAGVLSGQAAASAALSTNLNSGVFINAQIVDCQHSVVLSRMHGAYVNAQISSTKSEAAKLLSHYGTQWLSTDSLVTAFDSLYTKNLHAVITGNAGSCTYKARIGGATTGASGLNGATEFANIYLDLTGVASVSALLSVDVGGSSVKNSKIAISKSTASDLPDAWKTVTYNNDLDYSGTFTATLTGVDSSVTALASYTVRGNTVSLAIPYLSGTSNTNVATITGMPAWLSPSATRSFLGINYNASVSIASRLSIQTDGVIMLYNGLSTGVFNTSGSKGTLGQPITYSR